ncbi:MAG TPA: YncE family protein [Candidatus Dormibacteraeota bacterium]|nr:YncE family protein [Candidatus Dormibacteraeota bacterium]
MKLMAAIMAAALSLGMGAADAPNYHLVKKVPLSGAGGWDYLTVDGPARRLYVTHATQVIVLDADSLEVVGNIPGLAGVHGVAVAPEFGRGFITNGGSNSVTIFDLKTLAKIAEVKVGNKPDAIVYDPASKRVFAMNGDGDSSTAINAANGKIAGTVELGGGPEFTIADGKGNVFVNLEEKNELLRIDSAALTVKDRWPVAPCQAPSSLGFDAANNRLFLGCRSKVMAVVNAADGKVVASYPIGDHADATAFDPASKVAFTSTGDGNIFAFHQDSPDSYSAMPTIATAKGSKTMTIDRKTQRLFVPAREGDQMSLLVFEK